MKPQKVEKAVIFLVVVSALSVVGGAPPCSFAQEARKGDRATIHFTCKLKSGELAASSLKDLPQDTPPVKSAIYVPRETNDPVSVVVGEDLGADQPGKERSLEAEIISGLAHVVVGMRAGERREVELKGRPHGVVPPSEYFLSMARIRRRPKELTMTPEEYKSRTGRDPQEGQPYTVDPAIPGKVASVSETGVLIRFSAEPGSRAETPFGPAIVKDAESEYLLEIQAEIGRLVRSGPFVGRLTTVEGDNMTIDYGHPFGGEVLDCQVSLESVEKAHHVEAPSRGDS